MKNIEKAVKFLQNTYNSSDYFKQNPNAKEYRYQHTLRVSKIAMDLSEKEDLDKDIAVIGALLHDISYTIEFENKEDWENHGRNSAKMIQPFLMQLDLTKKQRVEILLGVANHVDGNSNFEGDLTSNSLTIIDSDNLDRFDTFRTFESLSYDRFYDKKIEDQLKYLKHRVDRITTLMKAEKEFATKTAKSMWRERLLKQKEVYEDLSRQLKEGANFLEIVRN